MIIDNKVIGLIGLANKPGGFTDAQIELLTTFAEQAAIAIRSAETFRALQNRTTELQEALARQGQAEAAATAFRERDVTGRILPSADWADLPPEDRDLLFDLQLESRRLERAIDPEALSSTARAVLGRVRRLGQADDYS